MSKPGAVAVPSDEPNNQRAGKYPGPLVAAKSEMLV
jgi:hypothetical protein